MKHRHLTNNGYIISRTKITPEQERTIKKDLSIKMDCIPAFAPVKIEPYKIFFYNDSYLYLPKYYGIEHFGVPIKNSICIGKDITANILISPMQHQTNSVKKLLTIYNKETNPDGGGGILVLPCGYGKCHGIDTKIMMYDFTVKNVQDIKPGEKLLGDDFTERIVYSTVIGYGNMYKIIPLEHIDVLTKYTVNEDHILSLLDDEDNIHNINVKDLYNIIGYNQYYGYTIKSNDDNIHNHNHNLKFKIKIEQIEPNNYYGFNISGNHLYALADMQITHNTYLALFTACNLKQKTMIIVTKEFLRDQWIEAIARFTTATYGIIQQDKCDTSCDITIAMIHTLCKRDIDLTKTGYGLLIIDECHHLASEMFVKSLFKIRPRFILGLSATPERPDGLSHVFYKFIGGIIHEELRTGINNLIVKKIIISSDSIDYKTIFREDGMKNTIEMASVLSRSESRNKLILELIKTFVEKNRTVLILTSRRKHTHDLYDMIKDAKFKTADYSRDVTFGFYYGKAPGTSDAEHKRMLVETDKCDIVIGTEHIAKEGLDIPTLNTLIFATPPGIYIKQAVGRILRKYHEINYPIVIDIVDKVGNFEKHSKERDEWYTTENYPIHNMHITLETHDINKINSYIITKDNIGNGKIINKIKRKQQKLEELTDVFSTCMLAEEPKVDKIKILKKKQLAKELIILNNVNDAEIDIFKHCLL